jgi:hypothetical protein
MKGKNKNHCNICPADLRGMCCWYSYFDGTDNFVIYPCEYLSKKTRRCKIYKNRFKINPNCLTVDEALKEGQLPIKCAYVIESSIIPIRPHKSINVDKIEMIKNGIKKGRFHTSDRLERAKGISS